MVAGKVVFITGTGRGQGRAAALAFCAEGAHVVGGDIDAAAAVQTARLAGAAGGSVLDAGPLDVTDEDSVRAWIGTGVARHGRIDVLYDNARRRALGGDRRGTVRRLGVHPAQRARLGLP